MKYRQVSLMESSSEGSPIKRESKCFIKNSNLWNSWDDGMMTYEADQGIEALSIKETVAGSLDDSKEK